MESGDKPEYYGRDLEAMSFAVNYHRWVIDEFRPYLGERTADMGAGTGNFSNLLLEAYVTEQLVAFEPSANMYPLLEERLGIRDNVETVNGGLSSEYFNSDKSFDSILYVNVLEHIEDDGEELSNARMALKSGGHLLLFIPALSFLYSELDRLLGHFRRYGKRGLIELVQSAGFEVVKVKYFDCMGIVPWYLTYVLLKRTISRNDVIYYDRLVVPVMRRIERLIPPPIGKNILLVGRKA
jgi:SAM-dependent methyltransferase